MFRKYRSKHHRSSAGPCDAVMQVVGYARRQEAVRRLNDQAENSHLPFRRQQHAMHAFRCKPSMQKFGPIHASDSTPFWVKNVNHFALRKIIIV
ncbi:hypothetical protein CSC82_20015 [Rhodobacteraceae bacterium 4F10]|nr:hypothetical protein CSC82_20015 [Rhodobacteraceae bacterium 4F10]